VSERRGDAKDQCNGESGRAEPENSRRISARRGTRYAIVGFPIVDLTTTRRDTLRGPRSGVRGASSRYRSRFRLNGERGAERSVERAGHYKIDRRASSYITFHVCVTSHAERVPTRELLKHERALFVGGPRNQRRNRCAFFEDRRKFVTRKPRRRRFESIDAHAGRAIYVIIDAAIINLSSRSARNPTRGEFHAARNRRRNLKRARPSSWKK